ncbi:translation initiation factor IF-2 [Candidatus Kaiserbacteria bacterium RIFCSPHIGHO2_02_FULL_49_34]|uniref:Translation initiation factor IF-2 n=1 Tax=Candidatus Kaiserbacteria bacterium RIFCSPHIGHO2_02_FULL_49_34 TaxID=1798491 RepID=A0A1F6DJP5_9BACT|nr:MAG: translation initiation factor IF-2 [Candidatus Kaiserbacteria bacterium RIFCSPHIGHO2_02_FULL_49_34]
MATQKRPPVIVVMGHIDHGKSTLLDTIRKTNIVDTEAGGITQHLSAYTVSHTSQEHGVRSLTFLDTPGHASFQKMRLRGADVADIAVLIVSAEDAVMPQTLEALAAIKEAKIPYIVAINKIDKPNADLVRTQSSLIENEIFIEGMGGDIPWVAISAKQGTGIDELLDTLILTAELNEVEGDPDAPAVGTVIEGGLDKKRGIAATIIVKNGSIKAGSFVVAEHALAPVRIMENTFGKQVKEAGLSEPVEIIGWSEIPRAGAEFVVVKTKKEAEALVFDFKETKIRNAPVTRYKMQTIPLIPVVIKADTLGSIEAITTEIDKLKNDRVDIKIVSATIGDISVTDIQNANATSHAIVVGFHNKIDRPATELAERLNVATKSFEIIYDLADWMKTMIDDRLPRKEEEVESGKIKILKHFSAQKNVHVMGGKVLEGTMSVKQRVHIMRRDIKLGNGVVENLQQSKSNVERVTEGEFGMQIATKVDVSEGDVLVPFTIVVS